MPTEDHRDSMPAQIWFVGALLAFLRAIPFIVTRIVPSAPGVENLPIGYNPKDWLSYVAFIRQEEFSMVNPFVTEAQDGRFILLFHSLLGKISSLTGIDPFLALELSRVPLIFVFFWVLWRFLTPILPDLRHRRFACWLVAFSGGIEYLYLLFAGAIPVQSAATLAQATWHLQGWSTFAAFYNPLWVVALVLCLLVLAPILRPEPPTARDRLTVGIGTLLLFLTHPYSAILVIATYCMVPLLGVLFGRHAWPGNSRTLTAPLVLALAVATTISLWQWGDASFRASSGGILGSQDLSVFWYPLTLGALLFFGVRGWQTWITQSHPWLWGLGAWTLAAIVLHSSPLLNGYHFAMYLHIPLCIVAASAVVAAFDSMRAKKFSVLGLVGLFAVLFASSAFVTIQSAREAQAQSQVPVDYLRAVDFLSEGSPGNVLASPDLGNLIPAYSDNRVFSGQWFLTPDFEARNNYYWTLVQNPSTHAADLQQLILQQRIRYLVAPTRLGAGLRSALDRSVTREVPMGSIIIFVLTASPNPKASETQTGVTGSQ